MANHNLHIENVHLSETVRKNPKQSKSHPLELIAKETHLDVHIPAEFAQPEHFFLLDHPDLWGSHNDQRQEPVYKRIAAAGHLKHLTAQETRNYVERGLRAKGWKNDPKIDAPVFHIIHQFSEGVPKRINMICNGLLLQCFVEQRHRITTTDAATFVKELSVEKSITHKRHSEELSVLPPLREILSEEQVPTEPAPEEWLPLESLKPAQLLPPHTSVSPRQKAHFEPRNFSLAKNRTRRGNW